MEIKLFAYKKGSSVIHKIPALIKIFFLLFFCIFTFTKNQELKLNELFSNSVVIKTSSLLIISILLFCLSGANWKSLKNILFVFILGTFVTLFRMFYFGSTQDENLNIIMLTKSFGIDLNGLSGGILYTIKFFTTTLTAQIIFETTSSLEIKNALECLQNYIAVICPIIKKWNPALVIALALNFIPLIFEIWNKVNLAARARSYGNKKKLLNIIITTFKELEALLSCLIYKAEIKRQALINRRQI